ncbi:MAG: hypothetical protein GXO15_04425 [Crenarchaeota archaeon]|nr:hypothetical protein [Thermoproteota archaeon]
MTRYPMLGVEYLYPKVLASRQLSYEDDLRALLAQYTEDETTLQLYAATKLARFLPEGGRVEEPSAVEMAALRYYVAALEKFRERLPPRAGPLFEAYRVYVVARDVELIARRMLQGRPLPGPGELAYPEAPEVQAARRRAEEEAPVVEVLRAAGLAEAARLLEKARDVEALLSPAVDAEIVSRLEAARAAASTPEGRRILENRVDIHAARAAAALAAARPGRELLSLYRGVLRGHRLQLDQLMEAAETGDLEALEKLLVETLQGRVPEELPPLEAFTAQLRKENRRLAAGLPYREPLTYDTLVGLLETLLLDEEDAVIIALAGYSRQRKSIVAELVSL